MGQIWAPDGVLSTAGNGIGATGGELLVFGDGSGFHVKVQVGEAWVKGVYYVNDAALTLPDLEPADVSNPRIDAVVVRIDWTTDTGHLFVVPGIPGVTPAVPPLAVTPGNVFDMLLALVPVAANATTIGSGVVRDARVYTDLAQRIPVGAMMDWPTTAAPLGWLLCGGQAVDRVQYRNLFALLGTTYGIGDNVTTFNLPDLRGRVGVGLDNMGGLGAANRVPSAAGVGTSFAGGSATHTMTASELVSHVHTSGSLVATGGGASNGHVHNVNPPATNSGDISQAHTHGVNAQTGLTSGADSVGHTHSTPGVSGTTDPDAAAHTHTATLTGTSGNPSVGHHHTTGATNSGFQSITAGAVTSLMVPTSPGDNTSDDTPVHTHSLSVTGSTGGASAAHSHTFSASGGTSGGTSTGHTHDTTVPSTTTVTENQGHVHAVDIAAFDSAGQSLDHTHSTTISGSTGGTGSTTAFSTMPPYLVVGKIIKV